MFAFAYPGPQKAERIPAHELYLTGNDGDVTPKTKPGLLLAGGGGDVDEAVRWFLSRSGGGDVVVLRASGSDGYNKYFPRIASVDSVESFVVKDRTASYDPELLKRVQQAEAIFLAGGDQWKYISYWKGTPLGKAIEDALARGVPVGGTSAGLAVLGEHSFSAALDTITTAEALADPESPKVALESAFLHLAPMKGMITDSHFRERDRMGRLLVFLSRLRTAGHQNVRGLGIAEGTAVAMETDGTSRVMGKGTAYLVEPRSPEQFRVCRQSAGSTFPVRRSSGCTGDVYSIRVQDGRVFSTRDDNSLY